MNASKTSFKIVIPPQISAEKLLGSEREILRTLQQKLSGSQFDLRENIINVEVDNSEVALVESLFEELFHAYERGMPFTPISVEKALELLYQEKPQRDSFQAGNQMIIPKSTGQSEYIEAIDHNSVVFGIGPAGSGKTYLAMAKAVESLLSGQVRRIILTRPAVEAGESLGFLPGTLNEKIDPYLRPLYDALREMLSGEELNALLESGTIEVAPLAYMRGRTLTDAFIVLDEAQNTTGPQMKMFLTRLGMRSTMVVTGDLSQQDLPRGTISGLAQASKALPGVAGVKFCYLTSADVIRNPVVGRIVEAYEQAENTELI